MATSRDITWKVDTMSAAELAVVELLHHIGEDPDRDGLVDTPARVARAFTELTRGYHQDPADILSKRFVTENDEMVVVRDIPFWSLCEHHMLPFYGTATVGYIPQGEGGVVGLSKLARLVDCFARRLQIQEQMTTEIADAMWTHLKPVGVGVVVTGNHLCMAMRGIQKSAPLVTSAMIGAMREKPAARAEFMALARN